MLYIHSNPVTGNDWEKNMGGIRSWSIRSIVETDVNP